MVYTCGLLFCFPVHNIRKLSFPCAVIVYCCMFLLNFIMIIGVEQYYSSQCRRVKLLKSRISVSLHLSSCWAGQCGLLAFIHCQPAVNLMILAHGDKKNKPENIEFCPTGFEIVRSNMPLACLYLWKKYWKLHNYKKWYK